MPCPYFRPLAMIGFITALCTRCLAADVSSPRQKIELPDGEVLVGSVEREDETAYIFLSQTLGEVRVPKAGAHLIQLPPDKSEMAEQPPGWVKAKPLTAAPGTAATPELAKWKRSFEAGYSYQSRGSLVSSTATYLRSEISYERPEGSVGVMGRYLYGSQNGERNTDKLDAGVKLRGNYADRVIVRDDFTYSYDRLKELSNEFSEIAGVNFVLLKFPRFTYSLGPGIAVQYAETDSDPGQTGYTVLGDFSHDLCWKISDRVSFTNNSGYLFRPSDTRDYRLRSYSALTGKITEQTSVNLRYEYEFEAIQPVANGRSDHRVFTTIGYSF